MCALLYITYEGIIDVVLALCKRFSSCCIFAQVLATRSGANTYASIHLGHVLPTLFSLFYCSMRQAWIGIFKPVPPNPNIRTRFTMIAIWHNNVPSYETRIVDVEMCEEPRT